MKIIVLPLSAVADIVDRFRQHTTTATAIRLSYKVDWPELQLTEEQHLANSIALIDGDNDPYPDPSFITIEIRA